MYKSEIDSLMYTISEDTNVIKSFHIEMQNKKIQNELLEQENKNLGFYISDMELQLKEK